MAGYFDSFSDFTPAGFVGNLYSSVSGNENPIDSLWNTVKGDPKGIKAAYDQALGQNEKFQQQMRTDMQGGQQKALGYYTPVQDMFKTAYGTAGLMPQGTR